MNVKHLLNGLAITALLAIAEPVWAQQPQPQWNPATGQPGLGAPMPAPAPSPSATSATPPAHHAVHHAKAMYAHHKQMAHKAALTGDTTAQLNREELARIQSGGPSAPPPPAAPAPAASMANAPNPNGGNAEGLPVPNPGGGGDLTPYTVTPPQR